jgi:superoxide dismutase, Fe-Mn family
MKNRRDIPPTSRREFIMRMAGAAAATAAILPSQIFASNQAGAPIRLPALPYASGALAPVISENTISYHYGKHHQGYVNNLNKLIAGKDLESFSLEEIIRKTAGYPEQSAVFNNAAQIFNHNFYWNSMKPDGGGEPKGRIAAKISESFGSYQKFAEAFSSAATSLFGSGYVWLVQTANGGRLEIIKTANAETPITGAAKPLITIDVWEHAYYLDYQNRRADYIKGYIEKLLNWSFAESNLA